MGEDEDNFYIDALAPGLEPESIDISIARNQLSIAGEKKPLREDFRSEGFHRRERATGRFMRSLTLGSEIDNQRIKANYDNGILRITLPKAEEAKPRKIQVNVS